MCTKSLINEKLSNCANSRENLTLVLLQREKTTNNGCDFTMALQLHFAPFNLFTFHTFQCQIGKGTIFKQEYRKALVPTKKSS